ncbi:MAG: hypothetical protein ACF8GE_08420 [Phycisphaerales bacterium JB043]
MSDFDFLDLSDSPARYTDTEAMRQQSTVGRGDAHTLALQLEARLERLSLVCEALWTMLRDYHNFTDNELRERINLIDLADGKLDGKKASGGPNACPKCSRAVSPRFNKCIYCSEPIQRDPFA